jgi:hypothetical protein
MREEKIGMVAVDLSGQRWGELFIDVGAPIFLAVGDERPDGQRHSYRGRLLR